MITKRFRFNILFIRDFLKSRVLIIILIVALGLFLRTYMMFHNFDFAHDGDLYSWIVKDIVVDKHMRLIGQLTSAPGIYIGSLFYYLLIPFFLIGHMDPIYTTILITFLGLVTLISYYFVFAKLFNPIVGIFAMYIHAISLSHVHFDRAVVPSTPTNLWVIWYFFVVVNITRGNFTYLPILAILISLIWHIHIALLPCLIAIPISLIVSRKIPTVRQILIFLILLILTSIPLMIFEFRHHFIQTISFVNNFTSNHGGGMGISKLDNVLAIVSKNISNLFFYPFSFPNYYQRIFSGLLLISIIILVKKRLVSILDVIPWLFWVIGILSFYVVSSSLISEYYFYNLEVIAIAIVSIWLNYIFSRTKVGSILIVILLTLVSLWNVYFFVTDKPYIIGYQDRKAAAAYITLDAKRHNFPCISISYFTHPGENVGFRYFFWLDKLHVNQPSSLSPVYTIVIPNELASEKNIIRFGHIGVIGPYNVLSNDEIKKSCSGGNSNLTDPLFGYSV